MGKVRHPLPKPPRPVGVVAAGACGTAQVGADVLRRGGNAVDAACAACFATCAFEPVLTSLAGGGLMLVVNGSNGQATVVDFFADAPGLRAKPNANLDFLPVTLDFGSATQVFHIGRGAAAVPGTLLGLHSALETFGSMTTVDLLAPTIAALTKGVPLDAFQAMTFELLSPNLVHSESVAALFAPEGHLLRANDRYFNVNLARALERMGQTGIAEYFRDFLAPQILEMFGARAGGSMTAADLGHYKVHLRDPFASRYRSANVLTPPLPSHGGRAVATMLALLDSIELRPLIRGSSDYLMALGTAMRVADEARQRDVNPFDDLEYWRALFAQWLQMRAEHAVNRAAGPGSTTHVSVIDGAGNMASATFSYGEGCGFTIGDTGIVMNNFMGEEDLHPNGFHSSPPGQRLPTNMCPTAVNDSGRRFVLGSGGSSRIRSAMTQVIVNLIDFCMSPQEAVGASRLHVEAAMVNAEVFDLAGVVELESVARGARGTATFLSPNLFFGGVHVAVLDAAGRYAGAGDPRRNGAVEVVD